MKIRAKKAGELTLHGFGINWIHKDGDEKDFAEDAAIRILTNKNYEKVESKETTFGKEITWTKKKSDKKDKKETGGSK